MSCASETIRTAVGRASRAGQELNRADTAATRRNPRQLRGADTTPSFSNAAGESLPTAAAKPLNCRTGSRPRADRANGRIDRGGGGVVTAGRKKH